MREYCAFTDESYITAERYRSIATFSFSREFYNDVSTALCEMLQESDVTEFKWKKLESAKYRLCAEKIINYVLAELYSKEFRVDVLIWDTADSRHAIQNRDDIANFERMFYHLLKWVMKKREKAAGWHIRPDERLEIDWDTVNDCLHNVGRWREFLENPLFGSQWSETNFEIKTFKQVKSHEQACCQVADLFAGISVFSDKIFTKFQMWRRHAAGQSSLFEDENNQQLTNSEQERFPVLKRLIDLCKSQTLGVSFESHQHLSTPNPNNPINFWWYKPQHMEDKAPVKGTEVHNVRAENIIGFEKAI